MRQEVASRQKEIVSSLLRQLRTDAGLRQVDLAERLGEPQSYVSRYESGEQRLDIIEIRTICRALGVSLVAFVERLEQRL